MERPSILSIKVKELTPIENITTRTVAIIGTNVNNYETDEFKAENIVTHLLPQIATPDLY